MKRFFSIATWILSTAILLITSCSEGNEPQVEPKPEPEPDVALSFTLSVDEISSAAITFTIAPSKEDAPYYAALYHISELATERDIAVAATLLTMEAAYYGTQTITATELSPESDYKVLYFGYDAESKSYTTDYILSDTIRTGDFEISEGINLAVIEGSQTWRDAAVRIVPSAEDMEYIFDIMTKSEWEESYAQNPEAIVEERIRLWEQDVEWGLEHYPDLDTWQKYMQCYQSCGSRTIYVSEYYNLRWDSDYVLYAFGMNDEGFQTADVVTTEFSTTKPVASENSFEIEINAVISTGVKFTITPTNNDPYFVTIQDKRYVERFGEGKEESLEDMIWDLTFNKTDQQISNYIFSATQELTNDSIAKIVDTLHEYHIVVFGFDEGPTTEVSISEAFQPTEG